MLGHSIDPWDLGAISAFDDLIIGFLKTRRLFALQEAQGTPRFLFSCITSIADVTFLTSMIIMLISLNPNHTFGIYCLPDATLFEI